MPVSSMMALPPVRMPMSSSPNFFGLTDVNLLF